MSSNELVLCALLSRTILNFFMRKSMQNQKWNRALLPIGKLFFSNFNLNIFQTCLDLQNWLFLDCNLWIFKHSDVISVQLHIKLVFCGNIVTKKGDNICEISSIHLKHHLFFHHFFHLLRWFTWKATISGEKIVTIFGDNIVTKKGDNNCDRNFTIFSNH